MQRLVILVSIIAVGNQLLETHLPELVANVQNGCGLFSTANEQVAKEKGEKMPRHKNEYEARDKEGEGKSKDEEVETTMNKEEEMKDAIAGLQLEVGPEAGGGQSQPMEVDVVNAKGVTVAVAEGVTNIRVAVATDVVMEAACTKVATKESPARVSSSSEQSPPTSPNIAARLDALMDSITSTHCPTFDTPYDLEGLVVGHGVGNML